MLGMSEEKEFLNPILKNIETTEPLTSLQTWVRDAFVTYHTSTDTWHHSLVHLCRVAWLSSNTVHANMWILLPLSSALPESCVIGPLTSIRFSCSDLPIDA